MQATAFIFARFTTFDFNIVCHIIKGEKIEIHSFKVIHGIMSKAKKKRMKYFLIIERFIKCIGRKLKYIFLY